MAPSIVGCEPPDPLTAGWLVRYAGLCDRDHQELEGKVIEKECIVKLGDRWSNGFCDTDQRFLERENRFYSELAILAAKAEQAFLEQLQQNAEGDVDEEQPTSPKSSSSRPTSPKSSLSKSLNATSQSWQPSKREDPCLRPGVLPSQGTLQATGLDGCYEVLRPRVSIHCSPSEKATLLGALNRHTVVRGLAFATADGEPWLLLHEDAREDHLKMQCEAAFVPLSQKNLGCSDLLRRLPGRPGPGRNEWRQGAAKVIEQRKPEEFEGWKRFVQRLLVRALRLPRCLATAWRGNPETFVLVLERLDQPYWTCADPVRGCTLEQAAGAIEALAGFHAAFTDNRKLMGLQWLPTMPLREYSGHVERRFGERLKEHQKLLKQCMSRRTFAVLEKLGTHFDGLVRQLSKPPLTLLHGNFQPGHLRFSTQLHSTPTVVAYDWQFVCQGRGAYDFAMFLGRLGPPATREKLDMELVMRYLMGRGKYGKEERDEFLADVRAALLVAFAAFFISVAPKLDGEAVPAVVKHTMNSIRWFASAIEDWDCAHSIGDVEVDKPPPKKRAYLKKSKRRKAIPSEQKSDEVSPTVFKGGDLRILGSKSTYEKRESAAVGSFGRTKLLKVEEANRKLTSRGSALTPPEFPNPRGRTGSDLSFGVSSRPRTGSASQGSRGHSASSSRSASSGDDFIVGRPGDAFVVGRLGDMSPCARMSQINFLGKSQGHRASAKATYTTDERLVPQFVREGVHEDRTDA